MVCIRLSLRPLLLATPGLTTTSPRPVPPPPEHGFIRTTKAYIKHGTHGTHLAYCAQSSAVTGKAATARSYTTCGPAREGSVEECEGSAECGVWRSAKKVLVPHLRAHDGIIGVRIGPPWRACAPPRVEAGGRKVFLGGPPLSLAPFPAPALQTISSRPPLLFTPSCFTPMLFTPARARGRPAPAPAARSSRTPPAAQRPQAWE